jgi:hypothetical protein
MNLKIDLLDKLGNVFALELANNSIVLLNDIPSKFSSHDSNNFLLYE